MKHINFSKKIAYWLPVLLSLIIYNISIFENIRFIFGNLLILGLLICIAGLLSNKILIAFSKGISLILYHIMMYLQLAHYYLFHDKIKSSTLFIIFDSNTNESSAFLSLYFDTNLFIILFAMIISLVITLFYLFKPLENDYRWFNIKKDRILTNSLGLMLFMGMLTIHYLRSSTLPHVVYTAFQDYKKRNISYKKAMQNRYGGDFSNVNHKGIEDEIYVLIIGESTTKSHMGIYGYSRKTTPNLSKIKDELTIYNDVISPNAHTILSLEKCLTLLNHESKENNIGGTIIQLFNKAGFETYWISNQIPMGVFETGVTIISKNCNQQVFLNVTSGSKLLSFDEKVLRPLKKVIDKSIKKKLIVIHLMGTHSTFSKRYPKQFEVFKDTPPTIKFNHAQSKKSVNSYDNAILYNDYVVNEIISIVKKENKDSFVLYFSDHGEELYQNEDFAGHRDEYSTKQMHDIPFILWTSEKYKKNHQFLLKNSSAKYSTEDLIYSLSDLANIEFDEFDETRSIFNVGFLERKRVVTNTKKNYIDFFKKE